MDRRLSYVTLIGVVLALAVVAAAVLGGGGLATKAGNRPAASPPTGGQPASTPEGTTTGPRAAAASAQGIYWGAMLGQQFGGLSAPASWTPVVDFEDRDSGGKAPSVLHFGGGHWYSTTCGGYCAFPADLMTATRSHGAIPFYDWGSDGQPDESPFTDAQIAAGAQDRYITEWAQAAKAWGHPFFLRLDWEMNGSWTPWGVGSSGTTPSDFVAMWRHVHDIFTGVGATNVTWVWCPNLDYKSSLPPFSSLYPGDAYVDWTCLSGYNAGVPWMSFHDLYAASYAGLTAVAPDKPVILGEVASTEHGGSKAQWITAMLADLPVSFPRVHGFLWYDRLTQGPGPYSDWPIESSPASSAAFARAIANPRFAGARYADFASAGPIAPPALSARRG